MRNQIKEKYYTRNFELRRKSVKQCHVVTRLFQILTTLWTHFINCFKRMSLRDEEMGHGYSLSKSQIAKGLKQFLEEEDRSILSYRYYLSLSA
ncbi:hypothetical protein BDA96_05G240800 [Sorghum bicolor]|uniref:Uncharacterized protein n=2 Tax=Sorghum bicolor TaxID=4558 RepID=A0A921R223_SORBI|nr:hypothetical protein BDA96_05G240800 [Sorghum bicolor]KXG27937.1 hypothetical protein SORBI_3005G065800 [Sorghum bicolor]